MTEALWPYLVVLVIGALPNEVFRVAAVVLARGLSEDSELFRWIRIVAVALLASVVAKIVVSPPGALAAVPVGVSILAIAAGVIAFWTTRILFASIFFGDAVFVLAAWWLA